MNVAVHQNKEKNEKTAKRKAGEERRQADFKEAACCLSAGIQGTARRKNSLWGGFPWVTETLGRANSHFSPTKRDWGRHHHVEAAVDWCNSILLGLFTVYTTEISLFTVQKD